MPKVLIVDDEPDVLLLLRVNLEAAGYETVLAADGETALSRIDDSDPDVVLLDIMMPVMDGWGVLRVLSERDSPPRVVVVSAKSSDRDIVRALSAGALDYITTNKTGRTDVWLLSDLQRSDWDAAGGRWETLRGAFATPACGRRIRAFEIARRRFLDVPGGGRDLCGL